MSRMKLMNDTTTARALVRRPFARALAALTLAGAAVLSACEGDNLFSGDTAVIQHGPPLITSIDAPATIDEGATLDVRIKAIAPRGMEAVTVRYRRAINSEVKRSFLGQPDTVTVDASIAVPSETADSILIVQAFATDIGGRVSSIATDTIRVINQFVPIAGATLVPTTARMGDIRQ